MNVTGELRLTFGGGGELASSTYFALGRRIVRVADQCIIDAGGLVGRHVGDGVVAFFVAENSRGGGPPPRTPEADRATTR